MRVEVTVDENGRVISARVLSGLGYGLDESALDAARGWQFQPATRCGKALASAARFGAITPRSVISPVTSRAGVTSKP